MAILRTSSDWVNYLNTKATFSKEKLPINPSAIECYSVGNGKDIVIPYMFNPATPLVFPNFETDGTTASIKTFRFLNRYGTPCKVTYSGNATT